MLDFAHPFPGGHWVISSSIAHLSIAVWTNAALVQEGLPDNPYIRDFAGAAAGISHSGSDRGYRLQIEW